MSAMCRVTRHQQNNQDLEVRIMRAKLTIGTIIAAGIVLLSSSPARAHHAFAAEFDANKPIKFLDATVTKVMLVNPHSWIYVDVKQADGKIENWAIEAGSPNILLRRGVTKDTLKVGAKIVVDGYQSKDGSHRANGRDLTLPNGQQLFLGSSGPDGAPNEVQRPGVDTK
jgi:hypothetical protein